MGLYRMTGDRTLSKAEKTKPDYSYGLSKMHRKHCHAPSFSVGGGGGTSYLLTGGVRKEGGRLSLSPTDRCTFGDGERGILRCMKIGGGEKEGG